ncbi:MAG: signal peptidase II [Bacteroidales bacterium]|nr:signal peptidase II [Bacteroidales bacterium]
MFLYLILTIILVTIDQITKYLTVQNLVLFEVKEIIPKFLSFTYIQNSGAAWSLLEGKMWFFYIITLIVVAFLLYYLYTEGRKDKILGVILSIILAGTLGNFIDRVLFQYVVDMIKLEFINFPIFNVADMLLTIGVAVLLFYTIYEEKNPRPSEGDMR